MNEKSEPVQPTFPPGLFVEKCAYVVDTNQVGWWIDPEAQTITCAKDTK